MAKKLFSIIIGLILWILIVPGASADYMERVTVIEFDKINRNLVISRPGSDEEWLLHLETKCNELERKTTTQLAIRGNLNGHHDYIKVSPYRKCLIDQAVKINGRLTVDRIIRSKNREARLLDENGNVYWIEYDERCRDMTRSIQKTIYIWKRGEDVNKFDTIYLPRNAGQCPILYLRTAEKKLKVKKKEDKSTDSTKPSTVIRAKAIPRDGKVFLYWKAATDNKAVDHYLVSVSSHPIDPKDYQIKDMPNVIQAKNTHIQITDLKNEQRYYFYVLAVDTSDNTSSHWSEPAEARPTRAIHEISVYPTGVYELNLKKIYESDRTFIFKWDKIPAATNQIVILNMEGKRVFTRLKHNKNIIRILKRPSRKGEKLELIVRARNLKGVLKEERIKFEF